MYLISKKIHTINGDKMRDKIKYNHTSNYIDMYERTTNSLNNNYDYTIRGFNKRLSENDYNRFRNIINKDYYK